MRDISSLTLVLSDTCNFSCPYCPERKGKNSLTIGDIAAFLEHMKPRMARKVWLGFYGGEPLLSWALVKKTVAWAEHGFKNRFRFTLTTNGSLLQDEPILFFKKHRFDLVVSYDGLAQKDRDARSISAVEKALADLQELYPGGYIVNSVFTPKTVPLLAASIERLLQQGHRRLRYALVQNAPWDHGHLKALEEQLGRLSVIAAEHWRKTAKMPLENLNDAGGKGIFACFAGRDRLALLPDRSVWGCYLFHDLLGHDPRHPDYARYCFGRLEEFMSAPAKTKAAVAANYAELRQDFFFTNKRELCSLCNDVERCAACPAVAAMASGTLAVLPAWTCRIQRITRAASSRFHAQRLENRA